MQNGVKKSAKSTRFGRYKCPTEKEMRNITPKTVQVPDTGKVEKRNAVS